ncbi:MAG TPA: hypothetical protein VH595_16410 [Verrucomicrobiae bacterium]|jgi:hypothetical protein|nr:hypothetical protein [Verrucomicrobiae bacterium]
MKIIIFLFGALISSMASAQPYSITSYKVAAGGGTSSGGQYSLNGTAGQHDAGGPMTAGGYSLTGGFWAMYAVQTSGAPLLTILWVNPAMVKVSWPSASAGFALQQNSDLATANWSNNSGTVNDDGVTKTVTITSPSGILFFRLKK